MFDYLVAQVFPMVCCDFAQAGHPVDDVHGEHRSLPGIWLTPVLRDSELAGDLRRNAAPFLLVGGTADPSWDPELARSFGQPLYEAQDADHGMETHDDPVNSAEVLRHATIAMDAFVRSL